jgi:hypothetical protein
MKRGGAPNWSQTKGKTRKRRVIAIEWHRRCVDYRIQGLTYDEIAVKCGVTASRCVQVVLKYMEDQRQHNMQEARTIRDMELKRLDLLLKKFWARAMKGNIEHATMAMKILERRAKYIGIETPIQVQISRTPPQFHGKSARELMQMVQSKISPELLDKKIDEHGSAPSGPTPATEDENASGRNGST